MQFRLCGVLCELFFPPISPPHDLNLHETVAKYDIKLIRNAPFWHASLARAELHQSNFRDEARKIVSSVLHLTMRTASFGLSWREEHIFSCLLLRF